MKKILYILSIPILFISCNKQVSIIRNLEVLDCTNLKVEKSLDISDKFNCKTVFLETTSECVIGSIKKILIKNNYIYVFDKNVSKSLFVFDMSGKYLFKISPYGRGQGECMFLTDFDIYKNNIVFLSGFDRKLLLYDLKGNFEKEIKLESFGNKNLKVFSENLFLTTGCGAGKRKVEFWNEKGEIVGSYNNKYLPGTYGVLKGLSILKDTAYVNMSFNDTIFAVTKNKEFYPFIYLDFGTKHFPLEKIKNEKDLSKLYEEGYYYNILGIVINRDYIFLNLTIEKRITSFIYNRKIHEGKEAKVLMYKGAMLGIMSGDYANGFISSIDAYLLKSCVNNMKENGNKDYKKCLKLNSSDNPVLFIVTEKNHQN